MKLISLSRLGEILEILTGYFLESRSLLKQHQNGRNGEQTERADLQRLSLHVCQQKLLRIVPAVRRVHMPRVCFHLL